MGLDIRHAACNFVYTLTILRQPSLCAVLYITTVNGSQTYSWFLAHQEEEERVSVEVQTLQVLMLILKMRDTNPTSVAKSGKAWNS